MSQLLDVGQKNHLTNKDTKHSQQEDFVHKIEDIVRLCKCRETSMQQVTVLFCHNLLKGTDRGKNHVQKE
jgi:hypothetical protein